MSYLVLARKYRPRNFEEMVGQEHVVKALTNALEQQRLHHAYLFTGTRGVGKTTVSRILAKSLNCQGVDGKGGITAEPCGVCQACQDIDAGRFVDYTELDAASNRGVDEVQGLLEQAVYKPVQGRFKVFMIDEVHMLTNTAFNAMLKTLEEPPEYLKFVLATTDPQKVPVTVLSRCLQFNLRPMAPETIAEHLDAVLTRETVAHDAAAVRLISRAARGSMRDALSLTDQAIAFGGGELREPNVRQMLGVVDKQYIYQIIEALAQAQGKAVVQLCDTLRRNGTPAASVLEDMALALQKMAVYQSVPEHAQAAQGGDADEQRLLQYAAMLAPDETQLLYSFCLKGREELGLAPDEYSGLVMVLLRILAYKAPPVPLGAALPVAAQPAAQLPEATAKVTAPATVTVGTSAAAPVLNAVEAQAAAEDVKEAKDPPAALQPAERQKEQEQQEQQKAQPTAAPIASGVMQPAKHAPAPAQDRTPKVETQTPGDAQELHAQQSYVKEPHAKESYGEGPYAPEHQTPLRQLRQPEPAGHPLPWDDEPPEGLSASAQGAALAAVNPANASAATPTPAFANVFPENATPANTTLAAQTDQVPPQRQAQPDAHAQVESAPQATEPEPPQAFILPNEQLLPAQWWIALVQALVRAGKLTALVRELAVQCEMLDRDAQNFYLQLKNKSLDNTSLRSKLAAVLQSVGLQQKLHIELGQAQETPAAFTEQQKNLEMTLARQIVENDPLVQQMQQRFGGEIVPGSIQPVAINLSDDAAGDAADA